ncbi:MAG: sugar transferase [Caldilineaceae bacterium]
MLGFAFWIAYWVRFYTNLPFFDLEVVPSLPYYTVVSLALTGVWIVCFWVFRLYERENLLGGFQEYSRLANACTVATAVVAMSSFVKLEFVIARGWLFLALFLTFALAGSARFLLRRVVYQLRMKGYFVVPALVVGHNGEAIALAEQLAGWKTSGLHGVGLASDALPSGSWAAPGLEVVGDLKALPALVSKYGVEELIVASSSLSSNQLLELFRQFGGQSSVALRMSSGLFDIFTTGLRVHSMGYVPLISVDKVRLSPPEALLKNTLDRLGAFFGLLMLSPLLAAIALAVRFDSPGPVIYRRRVLGRGGDTFDAFKFRTMHVNGDDLLTPEERRILQREHKLTDDPRITRVGNFLRKYSLDELPQLVNVLIGQMSLIGPRMITVSEKEMYGQWDMNLLTVKPGLSGLWQVSGRSDLSYEERVRLDMYYIRNYTIWLDIQLLYRTVLVVFQGRGAY